MQTNFQHGFWWGHLNHCFLLGGSENLHHKMLWNTTPVFSIYFQLPTSQARLPSWSWVALLLVEIRPVRIKGKSLATEMIASYNISSQHHKNLWWKKWKLMLHKIYIHCDNGCAFLGCDISFHSQSSCSIWINNTIHWIPLPTLFMVRKVYCRQWPWAGLVLWYTISCSRYTTFLLFSCLLYYVSIYPRNKQQFHFASSQ